MNEMHDRLGRIRIDFWDEDNLSLSLFPYHPVKSGNADEATQFILGFKASDPKCIGAAAQHVADAVKRFSEIWKAEYGCRYIVPVPGHRAGEVPISSKAPCSIVATVFPWLRYPEELLFRRESIASAHMAYRGERPTSTAHFHSLGVNPMNLGGAGVILFDDVLVTGNTSQACKRQLQCYAGCGEVVRLFLGKTIT